MTKNIFSKGIRFQCQGSSNCCVSRGSYGFVYLSKKDILRLAKYTDLPIKDFINLYCDKTDGFVHFKERRKNGECQFLKGYKDCYWERNENIAFKYDPVNTTETIVNAVTSCGDLCSELQWCKAGVCEDLAEYTFDLKINFLALLLFKIIWCRCCTRLI